MALVRRTRADPKLSHTDDRLGRMHDVPSPRRPGMQVFIQKVRHVYLPFLIVAVGFVLTYSLVAWALVYSTRLIPLDEELAIFWLPFGLAWAPGLLWVWPRLGALELDARNGRMRELYLCVAVGTMIAPTVIGQLYLSKASAEISHLGEASELPRASLTKYYRVDRPCLRREGHQLERSADLIGRRRETLRFTISVAVPFCGFSGTGASAAPPAWLGITFSKTMQAFRPDDEKERTGRAFAQESEERFAAMDLADFTYLELIGPGAKRRGFEAALQKLDPVVREHVLLEPHHEAFEARTGKTGGWAVGSFGLGAVLWLIMLAIPGVHPAKLRQLADGTQATRARGKRWRAFFVPSRANFGTLVLAYLNVGVFVVMVFAGLGVVGFQLDDLVRWGACSRPLVHGPGVLRLVTSQFVHGGLMHILGNLYGLSFAGLMLESIIGGRGLLLAYLFAGVIGGLASIAVHPAAVTVGASGSIFGLFGVLFGLLLAKDARLEPFRNFLLVNAAIYVGLNLLLGAITPGVDAAAHVAGLLAGFALSPVLRFRKAALRASGGRPR